jgi:hypothetical protein
MPQIARDSLMTLEAYAKQRKEFRARVIEHKKVRTVHVGEHVTLQFEDELTIRYQVQEMLRIERISDPAGIEEELSVYNPLIPGGSDWKATFMLEYDDADERRAALARMVGIESRVWVQVAGCERAYAIADEDLERATEDKTSSVHFMRFELTPAMVAAVKHGAPIGMGIDHEAYTHKVAAVPENVRRSLQGDLA